MLSPQRNEFCNPVCLRQISSLHTRNVENNKGKTADRRETGKEGMKSFKLEGRNTTGKIDEKVRDGTWSSKPLICAVLGKLSIINQNDIMTR